LTGEYHTMIEVQLLCKRLHFRLVVLNDGARADHEKPDVATAFQHNVGSAQIKIHAFSRNDTPHTCANRRSGWNTEFFPHGPANRLQVRPRLNDDTIVNDFDFLFLHTLLDKPFPACVAVCEDAIRQDAHEFQSLDLARCHISAHISNRGDNRGADGQTRKRAGEYAWIPTAYVSDVELPLANIFLQAKLAGDAAPGIKTAVYGIGMHRHVSAQAIE